MAKRLADHRKFSTSIRSLPIESFGLQRIVRPSGEAAIYIAESVPSDWSMSWIVTMFGSFNAEAAPAS